MRKAYAAKGSKGYWQYKLNQLLADRRRRGTIVLASEIAGAYAQSGDKDGAFRWLDRAFAEHDGQDISLLKVDPTFRSLRDDPRFPAFLRKMGLPD